MTTDPWFNPSLYGWLPGTVFGCTVGLYGGITGWLAPRGRARGLVLGALWTFLAASTGFLAIGIFGLLSGQPYGVWYSLMLPGVIGVLVLGFNAPTVLRLYRIAEQRSLEAQDMGG
jgi:hypothetical protein